MAGAWLGGGSKEGLFRLQVESDEVLSILWCGVVLPRVSPEADGDCFCEFGCGGSDGVDPSVQDIGQAQS